MPGVADVERQMLRGIDLVDALDNKDGCKALDELASKISTDFLQVYQAQNQHLR